VQTAHAVVAVADDELPRGRLDLRGPGGQLAQGEEQAVRKARELVLPGLSHVDEQGPLAALEALRKVPSRWLL